MLLSLWDDSVRSVQKSCFRYRTRVQTPGRIWSGALLLVAAEPSGAVTKHEIYKRLSQHSPDAEAFNRALDSLLRAGELFTKNEARGRVLVSREPLDSRSVDRRARGRGLASIELAVPKAHERDLIVPPGLTLAPSRPKLSPDGKLSECGSPHVGDGRKIRPPRCGEHYRKCLERWKPRGQVQ